MMARILLREPESGAGAPAARLLFVSTLLVALIFAADVGLLLLTGKGAERRDFISYFAAGRQLVQHQDPYDPGATLALEGTLGFPPGGEALIVRNPPTALILVAPLGYVSFRIAAVLWSLLLLGCWIASVQLLWILLDRPRISFSVLGYQVSQAFAIALFAPALACIFYGQTALFALLGFVFFVRLHRSRPFLAGAALWLCALKPHLFLPFAAALLLWIVVTRSYQVLMGAVTALAASGLAVYVLDPLAWQQYFSMMHAAGLEREFIPCVSIALRFAVRPSATWLQYLPAVVGCTWAVSYSLYRRRTWNWIDDGALVVLVSMLVAPYAWFTDQVLAAPALLLVAYRSSFRSLLVLAILGSAVEAGVLVGFTMHSPFYLWTAPAWLAWYLAASLHPRAAQLNAPMQ